MREVGFDQIRPKRTSTLRGGWRRHAEGEEEHVRQDTSSEERERRGRTLMYQKIGIIIALRPARRDEPPPRPGGGAVSAGQISNICLTEDLPSTL